MIFQKLLLTNSDLMSIIISRISYGAAMVSTGVSRYDKRSAPDNRVKMSNLNNKRQQ